MNFELLAPAATLAVWSMIMLVWMAALRLPALAKLKMPAEKSRGGRGSDLDALLPGSIQWKAHNYNHLMEQPTVFYAVIIILFLAGGTSTDLYLAWAYVGIRIVHSLWQAIINTIPVRLTLFTISSVILAILAIRALIITI